MTVSNWTAENFDWKSTSSSIRRDMGESFLFEIYNYLDWKDTDKSKIYVGDNAELLLIRPSPRRNNIWFKLGGPI